MQRVPKVTRANVERVIRREFPSVDPALVAAILDEYGKDDRETSGRDRVHLAALKLAGGDLQQLRQQVRISRQDYRDVLPPPNTRWR